MENQRSARCLPVVFSIVFAARETNLTTARARKKVGARMLAKTIRYPYIGVENGLCETLRDGETSVFLCEPETFIYFKTRA